VRLAPSARYRAGDRLPAGIVNHYVTDGEVAVAPLSIAPEER